MEILFETLGPGVHCYSPFKKIASQNSCLNLSELCKNRILKCVTLRRLSTAVTELPLPKRLLRYIADLTTADFEKIECAPFSDVFSFNFLHRALTYRVICFQDGFEYMITYGYSRVEELILKDEHREWFDGQWYEVQRTFALVEGGLKCATTVVSGANKNKMRATFKRTGMNILNRKVTLMRGYLNTPDSTKPARMELVMGPLSLFLRYRVIDTDYDDYAVVWGCFESPKYSQILGHTENLWILSRNPTLEKVFRDKIYNYLDSINVSRAGLVDTAFENCTSQYSG